MSALSIFLLIIVILIVGVTVWVSNRMDPWN